MNISQKSWPFYVLILFLVIGLPSMDYMLKEQHKKECVQIQITADEAVAVKP